VFSGIRVLGVVCTWSDSSRWLKHFKHQYNIKLHVRHNEAGSVPDSAEEEKKILQEIAKGYMEEDIYNMDETGLFLLQITVTVAQ
jgi:hypothetical protein